MGLRNIGCDQSQVLEPERGGIAIGWIWSACCLELLDRDPFVSDAQHLTPAACLATPSSRISSVGMG